MYLRNTWYQAGWCDEVGSDAPLVRTLLEEPILIWRDETGALHALRDMCPHRFAPLSKGTICDNIVTCGYHGLAFDADGKCTHNPHGPVTSSMQVRSYPVMERYGAIWIWMGEADQADPEKLPDMSFMEESPDSAQIKGAIPTAADYRLLTDNIMDLSHVDYLHPTSLGGIMNQSKATTDVVEDRVVARWEATDADPIPVEKPKYAEGAKVDFWVQVDWHAPALMVLSTASTSTGTQHSEQDVVLTMHNMVPETEHSTHYFFCSVRRFALDDEEFSAFLKASLLNAFVNEDKPMVEAQQERMGSNEFWSLNPILLKSDAGGIRARRKLEELIEAERTDA